FRLVRCVDVVDRERTFNKAASMRSVRCDVCGTKALIAASQCPKCGHLFEVRDGFGEMVPLAFCAACDSYYPANLGSCRWCGTQPAPPPIAPKVWKGIGVGAVAVILGIGWLTRATEPKHALRAKVMAEQRPQAATAPSDSVAMVPVPDSVAPVAATSLTPPSTVVVSPTTRAIATAAKSRSSPAWVASVSKGWVVVRAGPNKSARLIASIGPNSRVQLGESRGDWRRVRARGLSGWVEPKSLFAQGQAVARRRVAASR
ncbi:MAG: SH3 domain-containing protein, partial [Gemmatimonadaceae bacterium]